MAAARLDGMLLVVQLDDALLGLLAPVKIGDELAGATLRRVSSELGLRLTFDDAGAPLHVEIFPAEKGSPAAARSARLCFAYRGKGSPRAMEVCQAVAARARVNEDRVLDALAAQDPDEGRVRETRGGALLTPAGSGKHRYVTLSPYIGCLIGCRFCYAQERVGIARAFRGLADAPWGSYVDARVDAPEVLARELPEHEGLPLKFCPIVSDPYHAVEAKMQLTRRCLEVLRDEATPRPVFVLTRAALVERDADLLASIEGAYVGFSIPTIDDSVRRAFEPRAAPVDERLAILRRLRSRGVRTFAVVQPPLPGDPDALLDGLAESAMSVSLDVLHGEQGAGASFDLHPEARDRAWQADRVELLRRGLADRGVPTWNGELPTGS
ncbi:MAG: radical SAM protein [Sandaracinaceae bacterium]